jgi:hypothetical protein
MTIRDIPSPQPSSREKHHHTIKAPSAGEGADRGEIKNLCSIQDKIVFKKNSGTLPTHETSFQLIYEQIRALIIRNSYL